jgi:hypothetical protein
MAAFILGNYPGICVEVMRETKKKKRVRMIGHRPGALEIRSLVTIATCHTNVYGGRHTRNTDIHKVCILHDKATN